MIYPKISLIAAIASGNRALGKDNQLIYKIPEDMRRFRELTMGHAVIMGRKTFESIGRPLPNRMNIVITTHPEILKDQGLFAASSIKEALDMAEEKEKREIFIIGGGKIFEEAIWRAEKLYLTIVYDNPDADVYFPDYSQFRTVVFEKEGQSGNLRYKFLDLER